MLGPLGIRGIESNEKTSVPASIQPLDSVDVMQGVNLRAMLLSQRKVVEVQGVLGMQNAAQHAIARIVAGALRRAAVRVGAIGPCVDADRNQLGPSSDA